jgi:hypothetical protein
MKITGKKMAMTAAVAASAAKVDDETDGERQPEQRERVEREPGRPNDRDGPEQGHRNRQEHVQSGGK